MRIAGLILIAWIAMPLAARAEVAAASESGFLIRAEAHTEASPAETWRALTRPNRWWSSAHTYSGDARNLSLDARAGGCWCERWAGGSVAHARVLAAFEHSGARTLRLEGSLGPLQDMGAVSILTFTVRPHGAGSTVTMTYRVAGDAVLGLNALSGPVDAVLMEQFDRLIRLSAHGAPN